ncbi:MAG TPA: hypothetical protein VNO21_16110 [Polyangiaceae bacterium]|nr:hypothetical protein [Polyangiaceae bacterium]
MSVQTSGCKSAAAKPQTSGHSAGRGIIALGATLALGGVMARVAVVLAFVTSFGAVVVAVLLARGSYEGPHPPLELVPSLTASALAWGAGVLLAFASALQALLRDRDQGIRQLVRMRGASASSYVRARIAGLALVLFIVTGAGVLLTGIASMLAARQPGLVFDVAQATIASLVYAAGFAAVMAPIAVAALGARSRAGGYFGLLVFIFLPELLLGWSRQLLPRAWGELGSIPSALAALRGSLMPNQFDLERLLRAAIVLGLVATVALVYVGRQVSRVDNERIAPARGERERGR